MKIKYDEKADALYWRLDEAEVIESEEVQPGIVLDFDRNNQVVGIEILSVKSKFPKADPKHIQFEIA